MKLSEATDEQKIRALAEKDSNCLVKGKMDVSGRIDLEGIKQIQLDAMREGMRRAEFIINHQPNPFQELNETKQNSGYAKAREEFKQAILSAAKQLTEKDFP